MTFPNAIEIELSKSNLKLLSKQRYLNVKSLSFNQRTITTTAATFGLKLATPKQ